MSLKEVLAGILSKDIGRGAGSRLMIVLLLAPPGLILLLRLGFHPLSDWLGGLTGKDLSGYYSLAALFSVSVISVIPGILFVFDSLRKSRTSPGKVSSLSGLSRPLIYAFLSSLILIVTAGLVADPVPSEGIIRLLLSALLFALQSVVIFVFILSLAGTYLRALVFVKVFSLFILAAPLGLVLNSPWNLLAFFSPFYWICWTWLTEIPFQAIFYGIIASGISAVILLLSGKR